MKKLIEEYENAVKESDAAEKAFEMNPENEENEKVFDLAYEKEFAAFLALANEIQTITKGEINFETAKIMIKTRFEDLKNIILMF